MIPNATRWNSKYDASKKVSQLKDKVIINPILADFDIDSMNFLTDNFSDYDIAKGIERSELEAALND